VSAGGKEPSYKATYDGGSLQSIKAGTGLKLYIDSTTVRLVNGKTEIANIPASAITEISYGQDVHRRGTAVAVGVFTLGLGALTALSKPKKHFVGLTWANGDQKGDLLCSATKTSTGEFWLGWRE
jgi:hypothetical protein